MKKILARHKHHWSTSDVTIASVTGIVFFLVSLVMNYYASIYATEVAGSAVPDLIISHLPVFNVDFIVNECAMFFFVFIFYQLIVHPKRIPFSFKSAALLIIIRSVFITLTHLGPFAQRSYIDQASLFGPFNLANDFFFSNHTALPFLFALIFWENKFIRNVSLFASVLFGVSVLLGHLHYSIDVFAAFFITYTVFHISQKFFANDYKMLNDKQI